MLYKNCRILIGTLLILNIYKNTNAQTSIEGNVLDSQNAPIPHAIVEFIRASNQSMYSDTSDDNGRYYITIPSENSDVGNTSSLPKRLTLNQNYPNPFNPSTVITYYLPTSGQVKLEVYNILGKKVRTLIDAYQNSGTQQTYWDGTDDNGRGISAGIYIYIIKSNNAHQIKKMVLLDGQYYSTLLQSQTKTKSLNKIDGELFTIQVRLDSLVLLDVQAIFPLNGTTINYDLIIKTTQQIHEISKPSPVVCEDSLAIGDTLHCFFPDMLCNLGHTLEFLCNFGDSTTSAWSIDSTQHVYSDTGQYEIRIQAHCVEDTNIISEWSDAKMCHVYAALPEHTVSRPYTPQGPDEGNADEKLIYSGYGAQCSHGHQVQYQFDWGDGSDLTEWGSTRHHMYHSGKRRQNFKIKIRARCIINHDIISEWNDKSITIYHEVSAPPKPVGPSTGVVGQPYIFTFFKSTCPIGHEQELCRYRVDREAELGYTDFYINFPPGSNSVEATIIFNRSGRYWIHSIAYCVGYENDEDFNLVSLDKFIKINDAE